MVEDRCADTAGQLKRAVQSVHICVPDFAGRGLRELNRRGTVPKLSWPKRLDGRHGLRAQEIVRRAEVLFEDEDALLPFGWSWSGSLIVTGRAEGLQDAIARRGAAPPSQADNPMVRIALQQLGEYVAAQEARRPSQQRYAGHNLSPV
jgi:hypothetical protein